MWPSGHSPGRLRRPAHPCPPAPSAELQLHGRAGSGVAWPRPGARTVACRSSSGQPYRPARHPRDSHPRDGTLRTDPAVTCSVHAPTAPVTVPAPLLSYPTAIPVTVPNPHLPWLHWLLPPSHHLGPPSGRPPHGQRRAGACPPGSAQAHLPGRGTCGVQGTGDRVLGLRGWGQGMGSSLHRL